MSTIRETNRMAGLMSGLDTEELVKAMSANTKARLNSQKQKLQKLEWKQESYRSVISKISDFKNKYLDILSHSLFYRKWAEDTRRYLRDDAAIATNPIYAYLRSVRYQNDFLYYYPEMDKMLAILYHQNKNNIMAAWYYQAWTALKKIDTDENETYTGNTHGS